MGPSRDLTLLDAELLDKLGSLMIGIRTDDIPLNVYEGARSPGRQQELYDVGRDPKLAHYGRTVTRAKPYQSAHQYGLAADLVFYVGGHWTWEEPRRGQWDRMQMLAHKAGLVTLSFERPHVQLPGFHREMMEPGPEKDDEWLAWLRRRLGGQV